MRIAGVALRRSSNSELSRIFKQPFVLRNLSTNAAFSGSPFDDDHNTNSSESTDEFGSRIFGDISTGNFTSDDFFKKLERYRSGNTMGSRLGVRNNFQPFHDLDESFNTLSDGMDGKLKKAAQYFEYDPEEIAKDDYAFRADMNFPRGMTYDIKDLDLTKPGVRKPLKRYQFEVTTEEVLRKADFRNVRFLANFITKAGIIIKRSQTGISAKAQRKVAMEIKTARAFGLMPFTTMGTKGFEVGKSMEDLDEDYEFETIADAGPFRA